jgi:hypothetical protein
LVPLLDPVAVPRISKIGRPRKRPESVTGDKAYSSKANRSALRHRKIVAVIPERDDQVERGFNRRKHWRGVATRFDKLGQHHQATQDLAETLVGYVPHRPGQGLNPAAAGPSTLPTWPTSPTRSPRR